MSTIYIDYANGREEFDLWPFNTVYYLRRLLSEDHRLMEIRFHIFRDEVELEDHAILNMHDVVTVFVDSIGYYPSKNK